MLASSGKVDLYTLQKLLTHKSPVMTQRYAHLRDQALKDTAQVAGGICVVSQIDGQKAPVFERSGMAKGPERRFQRFYHIAGASLMMKPFPAEREPVGPEMGSPVASKFSKALHTVFPMSKHLPLLLIYPSRYHRQYRSI